MALPSFLCCFHISSFFAMSNKQLPHFLYHGSGYEQTQLMPGFLHSGVEERWDETESNKWLYASTEKEVAIELGVGSAIGHVHHMERFSTHGDEVIITTSGKRLTLAEAIKIPAYLYCIIPKEKDHWVKNNNRTNGLDTEWKTQSVIDIVSCEQIDVKKWFSNKKVIFKAGMATESHKPAWMAW